MEVISEEKKGTEAQITEAQIFSGQGQDPVQGGVLQRGEGGKAVLLIDFKNKELADDFVSKIAATFPQYSTRDFFNLTGGKTSEEEYNKVLSSPSRYQHGSSVVLDNITDVGKVLNVLRKEPFNLSWGVAVSGNKAANTLLSSIGSLSH